NIFGMTGAALARVPVRIASRRESALRVAKQRLVERGAYRLAHRVVANCEEVRRQLIAEGLPPKKVTTLYNGLDLERLTPRVDLSREETLKSFGLPGNSAQSVVTIVANMRAHFLHPQPLCLKDHPTFLRAAHRVIAAVPNAAFVIAGEGELLHETRALAAELGIERNTFFIGRCARVADLLAVSDICVLSSSAEGFSNSILEYMAAARPVVVTDVGGAREAVVEGETGYLVASGDDRTMADRLISLLREPEHAGEMGQRGHQMVKEKFSSEAQVVRTQNLYDRLLESNTRTSVRAFSKVHREGFN
ncbi:MAG: glycosyltransferase, partial [Acidobacteriota bacterium]